MISARWLDLGRTDPWTFHSTYAGIAAARAADSLPTVVWGRVGAHVCLGQSQGMCEVSTLPDVPVVRRPLGGGMVWVDEKQMCYALVCPLESVPPRHVDWYEWALAPAVATFASYGLTVERHAEDLWLAGRKIAGSGAATIGRSAVVASSFLMHFPRARFARTVGAASLEFRTRLRDALDVAMTDWSEHASVPEGSSVRAVFEAAVTSRFGWHFKSGAVSAAEAAEIRSWRAELAEPIEAGIRRVPGGVKLNAALTLAMENGVPVLRRGGAGASARA